MTLTEDRDFSFTTLIKEGESYKVQVDGITGYWKNSLINQCTLENGEGTAAEGLVDVTVNCQGIYHFFANSGNTGERGLWRTDGSAEGTYLVHVINPDAGPWAGVYDRLTSYTINNKLYFYANVTGSGHQIRSSDGTSEGTAIFYNSGNSSVMARKSGK